jgi:hypothetical protein
LIAGLPPFDRHRSTFSRSNAPDRQHEAGGKPGERIMASKETTAIRTDRVMLEMLLLTGRALITGLAVSVAMAVPVLLLASGS